LRIVFICPPGPEENVDFLGGKVVAAIQQQIFGISKELASIEHKVYIIRRWSSTEPFETYGGITFVNIHQAYPFLGRMKREDNQKFLESFWSFVTYFEYSLKVLRRIQQIKPDIVNISSFLQGFFIIRLVKPAKVYITHSHDIYVHNTSHRILKKFFLKSTLSSCDAIVALTESIKLYLESMRFNVDEVIPNGLNPTEYKTAKSEGYILYSGKLVKHKRVIDLLESVSSLQTAVPVRVLIVGDGPEKASLIKYVTKNNLQNTVQFMHFLSQKEYRETLARCTVFVLPSIKEAFGVVIIEAMASGKPVIARRVTGPADIITHGCNGLLFKNPDDLRSCLQLVLSDENLRLKLEINAKKTIETKYTFAKIVKSYERLYRSLTESPKTNS
jgi:glycosyltransferase involved in cell wall biosynthesis